eukprot:TRINITY_DN8734_c0_g1_i2.p1 TRINITY_DN8734_c0_g1~~TRINITY_DN8734_c0_g1_i2.p1  ORF type:complete len:180 (+),score=54.24 TRINITY_DN8734_c0_g1_i2:27-566(+)
MRGLAMRGVFLSATKSSNNNIGCGFHSSQQIIPRNIAEINDSHIGMVSVDRIRDTCSRGQEVAVSQASRIFSTKFLSDQQTSTLEAGDQTSGTSSYLADLPIDHQLPIHNWILAYDMSNINIQMKTNVPEPFKAEESVEDTVEGVPAGLSDAKVNLETRSNMDTRLDLDTQIKDTYNLV